MTIVDVVTAGQTRLINKLKHCQFIDIIGNNLRLIDNKIGHLVCNNSGFIEKKYSKHRLDQS